MKRTISLTFAQSDPREQLWAQRIDKLPHRHFKQLILLLLEDADLDLKDQEIFNRQVEEFLAYRERGQKTPKKDDGLVQINEKSNKFGNLAL